MPSVFKVPARKQLGQHFLHEKEVQLKITQDYFSECLNGKIGAVIEIGPGMGALTKHLSKLSPSIPFYVIEKDMRFFPHLNQLLSKEQIIIADAMEINWPKLLSQLNIKDQTIWLVANLPYNISVPLYINLLECSNFTYMTLMFQEEVGAKILGPKNLKDSNMNALHALTTIYYECKKLMIVKPKSFTPPPKVNSIVLSICHRPSPLLSLSEFGKLKAFLHKLFLYRRKQLSNVIKSSYGEAGLKVLSTVENEIPSTIRAEALSIKNVLFLYEKFRDLQL